MIPPTYDLPARVVLICGPPCSGKTTLANARELGSPSDWWHDEPYRGQAERRIREARLRAEQDGRPPGTVAYIAEWFDQYRPWSGDSGPTNT